MFRIGIASAAERLCPLDLRRAVSARRMRNFAVELYELGVIDIGTKAGLYRLKVGAVELWPEVGDGVTG
jgi:hypothetical protein